jgi:hypothetical protein
MAYITHGAAKENISLYRRYHNMLMRCYNPKCSQYHNYGARGIIVCDEWLADPMVFVKWGERAGFSLGLTLERIDVNGPYSPQNCCFATKQAQARNRRNNLMIAWRGETKCLAAWCELLGCDVRRVSARLKSGMTTDEAFGPIGRPLTITVGDRTMSPQEWADEVGVTRFTIYRRYNLGLPITAPGRPRRPMHTWKARSGPKASTVWRTRPGKKPKLRAPQC